MSAFALKMIAIVTMTIDHFGAVMSWSAKYREYAPLMRMIGRVAFPIYAFFIAEGMRKTRNRPMYLLRLAVFALVSTVPFSLLITVSTRGLNAVPVYLDFSHSNVFLTLFLGAAAIYLFELIRGLSWGKRAPGVLLGFAAAVIPVIAADFLRTDYGSLGAALIFLTYSVMSLRDNRFLRVIPAALFAFWLYQGNEPYIAFAVSSSLLLLLYDGSPGPQRVRSFKLWFYIYYPAHLLTAYFVSIYLR